MVGFLFAGGWPARNIDSGHPPKFTTLRGPAVPPMKKFTIAIGSDHAGFAYKEAIKALLLKDGYTVRDFGTYSDASCDYPDFVRPVAEAVARGEFERGIVLGGSGNGEAMAANRYRGVRCALCWNAESARLARLHNDANMLSLAS